MEKLNEEGSVHEDEKIETAVKYPKKGKDYVALPASEQGQKESCDDKCRKRRLIIVLGIIALILLIIVIALCVVFLVLKKDTAEEDDGEDEDYQPVIHTDGRIHCNLAGISPSQRMCEVSGCEFNATTQPPRCVYPKAGRYTVLSKNDTGSTILMVLQNKENRRKREHHTDNVEVTATKPLLELPDQLYVTITREDDTISLKVANSEDKEDDEDRPPPPLKKRDTTDNFRINTAEKGESFYIHINRILQDGEEELVIDTRGYPILVTPHLVQLAGTMGADVITANGKTITANHQFSVWNSEDNPNLPYFMTSLQGSRDPVSTGVAVHTSAPLQLSFAAQKAGKIGFNLVQLGGDLEVVMFLGPSQDKVLTQLTDFYGKPHVTPWWSLGAIIHHQREPLEPLKSNVYKIDVLVKDSYISAPDMSQSIMATLEYVDPLIEPTVNGRDPAIRAAAYNETFLGTLSPYMAPGSFRQYVDYTHSYQRYELGNQEAICAKIARGYNLRDNYPLNYAPLKCSDNVINNSPFVKLQDTALHNGTICLDYLHTGEDVITKPAGLHRMVHNHYGTLQAQVIKDCRPAEAGTDYFMMSDSVSMGAGKLTTKSIEVKSREDLEGVVPQMVWYGSVGLHATTRLAESVTDQDLLWDYHRLNTLLLYTSADERGLAAMRPGQVTKLKEYMKGKYEMFPEWLTALHKMSGLSGHGSGNPVFQAMKPVDGVIMPQQFMLGGKMVVATGALLGKGNTVYLPEDNVWYYADARINETGLVGVEDQGDGVSYQYIKGGSVMMTTVIRDIDRITGNPILSVKRSDLKITVYPAAESGTFHETYYLSEDNSANVELLLKVDVLVDSNDERLKMTIGPSGAAMENDYRADHRSWDSIEIAAGGLKKRVRRVLMNDEVLPGTAYSYPSGEWWDANLVIYEDENGEEDTTLHKRYTIVIEYQ